jgi:hypothetical protein
MSTLQGFSKMPKAPIPPNSVYFVEDDCNVTWKHTVKKVKGTTELKEIVEMVDKGDAPMSCTWFILMLTLCLMPYALAIFATTLYFMLDDPLSLVRPMRSTSVPQTACNVDPLYLYPCAHSFLSLTSSMLSRGRGGGSCDACEIVRVPQVSQRRWC